MKKILKAIALVCLLGWVAAMVFIVIRVLKYKKKPEPQPAPVTRKKPAAKRAKRKTP